MTRILVGLITLVSLIAGTAYYLLHDKASFFVLFTATKDLAVGDSVYLSGRPVGKVVSIEPDMGKVGVGVHIDRKYRDQMGSASSFFIGQDPGKPGHMGLLVRTPTADRGDRLQAEDKVAGIDSPLVWSGLEMADRLQEMIRTEPWQELLREVDLLAQEFNKALATIDVDRLGAELRAEIETLSKKIDSALQGNESPKALNELQEQIEEIQQRLKRLAESEESRQLREALHNFQKRLRDEIRRQQDGSAT